LGGEEWGAFSTQGDQPSPKQEEKRKEGKVLRDHRYQFVGENQTKRGSRGNQGGAGGLFVQMKKSSRAKSYLKTGGTIEGAKPVRLITFAGKRKDEVSKKKTRPKKLTRERTG